MKYDFLAPARAELQEAVYYYEDRRPGLGEEFATEVRDTIDRILLNPTVWAKLSANVRRCRLRRFPYALIYQVKPDLILVVAVMHLRRDPVYWRSRLGL
jgi:toxin ParE2